MRSVIGGVRVDLWDWNARDLNVGDLDVGDLNVRERNAGELRQSWELERPDAAENFLRQKLNGCQPEVQSCSRLSHDGVD